MPNHVTNVITASPEVIEAITRFYTDQEQAEIRRQNDEMAANYKERTGNDWPYSAADEAKITDRFVDFELIVPSPPNKEQGNCSGSHPEGVVCWYQWNPQYWGTKWNAYDSSIDALPGDQARVRFDTAWSHPIPVVIALSEKFPDHTLVVEYADEDMGQNQGLYEITNGEITDHSVEDGSDEALEHAAQLKYGQTYAELRAEWDDEDAEAMPATTEEAQS